MKAAEKKIAITLRKQGCSYNEILKRVDVSKGTLSAWLCSLRLTGKQAKLLHKKVKHQSIVNGRKTRQRWLARRLSEYSNYNPPLSDPEFLLGLGLYWGEGLKSASKGSCSVTRLSNSDPAVCVLFIKWIKTYFAGKDFGIHIHHHRPKVDCQIRKYWAKALGVPLAKFTKSMFEFSRSSQRKAKMSTYGTAHIAVQGSGRWKIRFRIEKALDCIRHRIGLTAMTYGFQP